MLRQIGSHSTYGTNEFATFYSDIKKVQFRF